MYLAVFSKTSCPASGPGRPHSASPLGRQDAYIWLNSVLVLRLRTHSYTLFQLPGPIPFSKTTHTHARSLEPSSCPSIQSTSPSTCQLPHTAQHTSVASHLLLLYTQLPSSHINHLHVCLPLCNTSCSTLQYGSGSYNLLIRSTSLFDRGPGVPESPHYLPTIPTASP